MGIYLSNTMDTTTVHVTLVIDEEFSQAILELANSAL